MAKVSGRGDGVMSCREAGRRGGAATAATHDAAWYAAIGRKGGQKMKRLLEAGKRALEREGEG